MKTTFKLFSDIVVSKTCYEALITFKVKTNNAYIYIITLNKIYVPQKSIKVARIKNLIK